MHLQRLFGSAENNRCGCFQSWRYRQSFGDDLVLSFLPFVTIGPNREKNAILQMIFNDKCYRLDFPFSEVDIDRERQLLRMGENQFGRKGIKLQIRQENLELSGDLRFKQFTSPRKSLYAPGVMGPAAYFGKLEIHYEVLSLQHAVTGELSVNGKRLATAEGTGYLSKTKGSSFPPCWLWYQCGNFKNNPSVSVVLIAAENTAYGIKRNEIVAVCMVDGKEIRLASYYGAKLKEMEKDKGESIVMISQGDTVLTVRVRTGVPVSLSFPIKGEMNRIAYEYPCCQSQVILRKNGKTLIDDAGYASGFERVGEVTLSDHTKEALLNLPKESFMKVGKVNDCKKGS